MSHNKGLLASGADSPVRVGSRPTLPAGPAQMRTVPIAGTLVAYDIIPTMAQQRAVNLSTEAQHATTVALVCSYNSGTNTEIVASENPLLPRIGLPREHAAYISFGVGQALHTIEIDLVEGNTTSLPTQVAEVAIANYGTHSSPQFSHALDDAVSVAYRTSPATATKTQRAMVPLGLFRLALDGAGDLDAPQESLANALARPIAAQTPPAAYAAAMRRIAAILPGRRQF